MNESFRLCEFDEEGKLQASRSLYNGEYLEFDTMEKALKEIEHSPSQKEYVVVTVYSRELNLLDDNDLDI